MQRISFALLLLAGLGVTSSASADTLSLEGVEVGAPGSGAGSVSAHYFSVSEADSVDVFVDGAPWGSDDYISTQVYLFDMDGNVLATGVSLFDDGDVQFDVDLGAGEYMLAVGDFPLTAKEAWEGCNSPDAWEKFGAFKYDGKFDVSLSADNATLSWGGGGAEGEAQAVPELSADGSGAALLLLLGGFVLLGQRRRTAFAAA